MSHEVAVRHVAVPVVRDHLLAPLDYAAAAELQQEVIEKMVADGWGVHGWTAITEGGTTVGYMLYFGREKADKFPVPPGAADAGLGVRTPAPPNREQRRRMGR